MTDKKAVATIRKKNQITLPKEVLKDLDVGVGDSLLFKCSAFSSTQWIISKL